VLVRYVRRVRKIAKSDRYLRHVCLFLRTEQLGSQERNFMKFDILVIFENLSRKGFINIWQE
jgi:hypothetical protein